MRFRRLPFCDSLSFTRAGPDDRDSHQRARWVFRPRQRRQSLPGAAAQPRRMAILALLARAGQRGITREKVLALLWPDADDERGPRTLAQALYALRKDLGAEDTIAGAKEFRLDPSLV